MFGSIAFFFNSDDPSESDNEENPVQQYPSVPKKTEKLTKVAVKRPNCSTNKNNEQIRLQTKILRDATNVLELPEEQFINTYRINKKVFQVLLEEIEPKMKITYRSTHTPTHIKLATLLGVFASGAQKLAIDDVSALSKSQVSKVICEMLDIFEEHLWHKWVKLEQNEEEENSIKENFYNSTGIPGVVGCVDNIHVRIKTPDKEIKHLYKNPKGFFSLNVMMICDHSMIIKYVDATQPGAYQNDHVWDQSSANEYFKTNYLKGTENTWVVGDSSYKLLPYMMTPYRNPIEQHEHLFNEKLCEIRHIIKKCFNILRNRFNCLNTPLGLLYIPEKAVKIIKTCCIIHNICMAHKNNWQPSSKILEDSDDDDDDDEGGKKIETFFEECTISRSIRDKIALDLLHWVPEITENNSRLHRRNLRDAMNVLELPKESFIKRFRVNKEVFTMLLEEITPKFKVTYRSTHVPGPIKLATFLTFIATGGKIRNNGNECVSKSQVSRIISEMLDIFENHLHAKWIKLDQNQEEENTAKEHFYNISGIPGIVGCVENTHIRIKTPGKEIKHLYINSKGFSSLNILLICDQNMTIKYLDATQPGSYHDAYIWDQSSADHYFRTNYLNGKENTWVLGNSGYKLLPYVMIPYRNPVEPHQRLFNEKLCETRSVIKRCINVLKDRFGSLSVPTGLQYIPEKAVKTIITCCVLHNICLAYNNNWQLPSNTSEEADNDDDNDLDITMELFYEESSMSNFVRDEIAKNLYCLNTNLYVA